MTLYFSELAALLGGEHCGSDLEVTSISIDTRTLQPGEIYVAVRGARFNGNDFLAEAAQSGASGLIVERFTDHIRLPQIKVADGRLALGQMSAIWRSRWPGRLVGITGSNGKTTVKEMLAAVLGTLSPVHKTQGNLNNDYGVPLTLLRLQPHHKFAVIEMGANHIGEIAYTSRLAASDVVVLTNAGAAHLEGFGSLEGVARGKGELIETLSPDGTAVLNAGDPFFHYWRTLAGHRKTVTFGFSDEADVHIDPYSVSMGLENDQFHTSFDILYQSQRLPITMGLAGRHNILNALAVTAAAFALDCDSSAIQTGLASMTPVKGRLQLFPGIGGSVLIHDAYNANPSSFGVALDVLSTLPGESWVALGGLGELGKDSPHFHGELGKQVKLSGVQRLFTVGLYADCAAEAFGVGAIHCENREDMIDRIRSGGLSAGITLLVKGSRSQNMEQVVEALRAIP